MHLLQMGLCILKPKSKLLHQWGQFLESTQVAKWYRWPIEINDKNNDLPFLKLVIFQFAKREITKGIQSTTDNTCVFVGVGMDCCFYLLHNSIVLNQAPLSLSTMLTPIE